MGNIMQTKFTKEFMINNCGCYSSEQLQSCSFMSNEEITAKDILDSEIPFKDKVWFFFNKVFTKEQNQQFSILCAKSVLHIYENKYPNDLRPRKAIEAAELYLKGECSLKELRDADDAAAAAAEAADANAAYTAANAAYTAAYAAYAAHADYAAYADYAAAVTDLLQILKDFIYAN